MNTSAYVKSVIPFWRPRRRNMAASLIAKMPELSNYAMVLALIPELVAARARFCERWELYEFMIENWLKREKAWIQPQKLIEIAMTIATDLVINKQRRGTQSVSAQELAVLLRQSEVDILGWNLTSRSLLSHDASGRYSFIHRSILEFLFVKAFINGERACASTPWTDTMRDLFLSWGRVCADPASLEQLEWAFQINLSETKLFPLPLATEIATVVDVDCVRRVFSHDTEKTGLARVPFAWRRHTSRCDVREDMVRIYEFAEGKVWQWVKTKGYASHADRLLYYVDRFETKWGDRSLAGKTWGLPSLLELRSLLDVLAFHESMDAYLDDQAVYWINDADPDSVCVVRIREKSQSHKKPYELPGWQLLRSVPASGANTNIIDVYKTPKRGMAVSRAKALPIIVYRGDAYKVWLADKAAVSNSEHHDWGVHRLSPPPESAWLANA
ncbi:MAG: hypothetical protein ABI228_03535 [Burkholderiaceae bacterium]